MPFRKQCPILPTKLPEFHWKKLSLLHLQLSAREIDRVKWRTPTLPFFKELWKDCPCYYAKRMGSKSDSLQSWRIGLLHLYWTWQNLHHLNVQDQGHGLPWKALHGMWRTWKTFYLLDRVRNAVKPTGSQQCGILNYLREPNIAILGCSNFEEMHFVLQPKH